MSKKLRSIERILTVQKQKLQLAEWKVFELQRQQGILAQNQDALKQLLNREETFGSPLSIIATRTGQRTSMTAARLQQAEAVAQDEMRHEYRQFKLSENLCLERQQQAKREEEKQLLHSIIDQIGPKKT